MIAGVAAALGCGLAFAALLPPDVRNGPKIHSTTGTKLETLALAAAGQPEPQQISGGFRYAKVKEKTIQLTGGASPYEVVFSRVTETWIGVDGSGRSRSLLEGVEFPSDEDRAGWEAAGRPHFGTDNVEEQTYAPGELSYETFRDLPTDPDLLFKEIERRASTAGPGTAPEMFIVIGDLLRATNVPSDVRASLFLVAEKIPGVEISERTDDPEGRLGVSLSLVYDDQNGSLVKVERVFDPQTTRLLSEQKLVMAKTGAADLPSRPPGAPVARGTLQPPLLRAKPGTVVSSTVYLASAITAAAGEVPSSEPSIE